MSNVVHMTSRSDRFHVCHDCMIKLVGVHGARVDESVTEFGMGQTCEVHPSGLAVQAQHAVVTTPQRLEDFRTAARTARFNERAGHQPSSEEATAIGLMASHLLTGHPGASDSDVLAAVETARRIHKAAKE